MIVTRGNYTSYRSQRATALFAASGPPRAGSPYKSVIIGPRSFNRWSKPVLHHEAPQVVPGGAPDAAAKPDVDDRSHHNTPKCAKKTSRTCHKIRPGGVDIPVVRAHGARPWAIWCNMAILRATALVIMGPCTNGQRGGLPRWQLCCALNGLAEPEYDNNYKNFGLCLTPAERRYWAN